MKCLKCLTQKRRRFSWKLFSYVIFVVWNSHDIFCKNFNCQRGLFNSLLFSKQPALHTETWVYNKLKLEYDNFASKWASCCENRSIVIDQKFSLLVKTYTEWGFCRSVLHIEGIGLQEMAVFDISVLFTYPWLEKLKSSMCIADILMEKRLKMIETCHTLINHLICRLEPAIFKLQHSEMIFISENIDHSW